MISRLLNLAPGVDTRLDWRRLLRPGDWLVLLAGLAVLVLLWTRGTHQAGDAVIIKQAGRVFLETSLRLNRIVDVPGPLGVTRVEIRDGRARVLADPSPRQLCVRQGWIGPGSAALCLPNRVSVERGGVDYDSLNY